LKQVLQAILPDAPFQLLVQCGQLLLPPFHPARQELLQAFFSLDVLHVVQRRVFFYSRFAPISACVPAADW
jgi:hypothetical protein